LNKYAQGTTVSVTSSITEIRRTVVDRYGATAFSIAEDDSAIGVEFVCEGIQVRLTLPVPALSDKQFEARYSWQTTNESRKAKRDLEVKRLWRVLLMVVKTKLEMVAAGLDFKREFFPFIVLPDGHTVADHALPQVMKALQTGGGPPALLPRFEVKE
jgi:hypothetical protein